MRSPRSREPSAMEDDVQSNVSTCSSTVATTASLASRIAALALDLDETASKGKDGGATEELGTFPEEDEEEEVVEVTEDELIQALDSQEDPFQVCSRLFQQSMSNAMQLRTLNIINVEEFKQHGYLVLDNFITKEVATAIREEGLRLTKKGKLQAATDLGNKYHDRTARGDAIMWLHLGQPPLDTAVFAPLVVALQELQEDLQEFMKLKDSTVEYQLAHYPGNGTQYVKHRDAVPDDGSCPQLRRVTAIVYTNPDWKTEDGGCLRMWPPRKIVRVNHAAHIEHRHRTLEPVNIETQGTTYAAAYHHIPPSPSAAYRSHFAVNHRMASADTHNPPFPERRPPAGMPPIDSASARPPPVPSHPDSHVPGAIPIYSEGEVSVSEPSECGSLKSDTLDHVGRPKSTTSSLVAEAGWQGVDYDASSIDDISVSREPDHPRVGVEWVDVGGEMVLEVAPVAGRLVLFLSGCVDHCVLPSHCSRVAVTAWFQ